MKAVTIKTYGLVPKGKVYIMPDFDHLEIGSDTTVETAEHLVFICHPDDEQVVRDAVAIEQERPKWWRDQQKIEAWLLSE